MNESYVDQLITEYVSRKGANSRYSERAFAASLGLSAGFLKLLFQGKKQLGLARAHDVASRLNLREPKRSKFLKSVQASKERTPQHLAGKVLLNEDNFTEISDWYCFAIIELVKVKSGKITIQQAAEELSISRTEAAFAFSQMMRVGVLNKSVSGSEYSVPDFYEMPTLSSQAVRKFHRQVLLKAHASVSSQSHEQRELRGLTLAFEKARLDEAKKEIKKFVTVFEKKFGKGDVDSVYQLSLSMFRLDKE